jgi:hypothetical protein
MVIVGHEPSVGGARRRLEAALADTLPFVGTYALAAP